MHYLVTAWCNFFRHYSFRNSVAENPEVIGVSAKMALCECINPIKLTLLILDR